LDARQLRNVEFVVSKCIIMRRRKDGRITRFNGDGPIVFEKCLDGFGKHIPRVIAALCLRQL
jgi:hypothetical protein